MWLNKIKENSKRINSQGGQDGVIDYIISNIEIENKYCVEFGYSGTDWETSQPNCGNLVLTRGWDNLFFDGYHHNEEMNLHKIFMTTENILDAFKKHNVPKKLGYLSVDVDSTDLWLTEKLLSEYEPSFFSVEFNPNIPIHYAITLPNDPINSTWSGKVFGCSLKCLYIMSKKFGYSLVYAGKVSQDGHHDAFFIKDELIKDQDKPTLYDFQDVIEPIHHKNTDGKWEICLDYECFLETNDVEKSQKVVKEICRNIFC